MSSQTFHLVQRYSSLASDGHQMDEFLDSQILFIAQSLAFYVVHFLSAIAGISDYSNVPTSR